MPSITFYCRLKRRDSIETLLKHSTQSEVIKNSQILLHDAKENAYLKNKRAQMSISFFSLLKIIGRSDIGEIRVVKHNDNPKPLAMKVIKKNSLKKLRQTALDISSDIDLELGKTLWVAKFIYSFQDENFTYRVIEHCPGGDLMGRLDVCKTLSQEQTRFYMAELLLALDAMHELGIIHRSNFPNLT